MKCKVINELEIYVMHIADINNSIVIDSEVYNAYLDKGDITENEFLDIIRKLYQSDFEKYERILASKKNVEEAKKQETTAKEDLLTKSCFTLCLHPTRRCNLRCKYCFGHEDYLPKEEITIDVAKKAVDYVVFDYGKTGKMYTIDLAGSGEPLLRFEFLQELEEYCAEIRNKTGKKIIITFPTNATLLTQEHISYFEKHADILYGISIDGDRKANANRVYHNGENTFEDILKGIEITTNRHCGFAVTVSKENENVDEIYDFLYSLKKGDAISTHIIRDFSDSDTSVYKIDKANLLDSYRKLCVRIIEELKKGNVEYIRPLLNGDDILGGYILSAVQKGIITKYRCDAGQNRIAVDENGKIYACSVMNGDANFCIGDIYEGIKESQRERFTKSSIEESLQCTSCWCKNICRGECMTISYMTHKELYKPNDTMCEIKQRIAELAIAFAEYLKFNVPVGYNFIVGHIISSVDYGQTNSAVWSVVNYLNDNGYIVSYREIASILENIPCDKKNGLNLGPKMKNVEMVLKKYDSSICAVEIDGIQNIINIEKSIICRYITAQGRNEYCLIRKVNGKLFIYSLERNINGIKITDEMIKCGLKFFIGPFEEQIKE